MSEETPDSPAFGDASAPVEPVGPFDDKPMPTPGIASPAAIDVFVEANFGEQGKSYPTRAATLDAFVTAARSLKAAEDAYRAAQQTYAEAVKRLSEEAVR